MFTVDVKQQYNNNNSPESISIHLKPALGYVFSLASIQRVSRESGFPPYMSSFSKGQAGPRSAIGRAPDS